MILHAKRPAYPSENHNKDEHHGMVSALLLGQDIGMYHMFTIYACGKLSNVLIGHNELLAGRLARCGFRWWQSPCCSTRLRICGSSSCRFRAGTCTVVVGGSWLPHRIR